MTDTNGDTGLAGGCEEAKTDGASRGDGPSTSSLTGLESISRLSRRSTLLGLGGVGLFGSGLSFGAADAVTPAAAQPATAASSAVGLSQSESGPWSTTEIGHGANAVHEGAFVIADSSPQTFSSRGPDEVRSQMPIYAPTFETTSARAAKTDVEPVDPETVLEGVESLSISTWRFVHGDERHVGPMAEEFQETFELNGSDGSIATVDADGVALAAIQGLVQRLESENEHLEAELAERRETIAELESRLAEVEAEVSEE